MVAAEVLGVGSTTGAAIGAVMGGVLEGIAAEAAGVGTALGGGVGAAVEVGLGGWVTTRVALIPLQQGLPGMLLGARDCGRC